MCTKLVSDARNGIMITVSKVTPDPNPGRSSSGTTINIVSGATYLGATDPVSPEVRDSYNNLSRVDNMELTYRISPESGMTVHCPLRCSHGVSPDPPCFLGYES